MSYKFIPSVTIAICGTISNVLSLSYFSSKIKKGLGNNLLMLLNSLDLLVCLSGLMKIAVERHSKSVTKSYEESGYSDENLSKYETWQTLRVISKFIYRTSVEGTAFVTCVLSVTRTIKFCFVFFKVRKKVVIACLVGFFTYLVIREIIQAYYQYYAFIKEPKDSYDIQLGNWMRGAEILLAIVVLVISNILAVVRLKLMDRSCSGDGGVEANAKKRATITVIILSFLFTTFNSMLLTAIILETVVQIDLSWDFVLWYSVPTNSAVNPIVYMIRIKPMRKYIRKRFIILKNILSCKERTITIETTHIATPHSYA